MFNTNNKDEEKFIIIIKKTLNIVKGNKYTLKYSYKADFNYIEFVLKLRMI